MIIAFAARLLEHFGSETHDFCQARTLDDLRALATISVWTKIGQTKS